MKKFLTALGVVLVLLGGWFVFGNPQAVLFQPTETSEQAATTTEPAEVQAVAQNLAVPWGLAFLPNENILLTERSGGLLELTIDGEIVSENTIETAQETGEGGLLGITLHPDFAENNLLYMYETTETPDGTMNRVLRFRYENGELSGRETILDRIAGASYHDGGRIDFGPDDYLYIATGDAGETALAQDTDSVNGKILRITEDGSVPADNPFGNAVWSYGHRNPQGLVWSESGELFSSEHGPSGLESGEDEVNRITPGRNYGWPAVRGFIQLGPTADAPVGNYANPIYASGPDITWAPASLAIYDGQLFWAGLRGQALYVAPLKTEATAGDERGDIRTYFKEEYGRLRTVTVGPSEEYLYMTTSNTDGRGNPQTGDDKLLRVPLRFFAN